ncbi:hypothetical protein FB554_2391 [Barrientosiimonas humi]|uniref:Uncharacterized protein n=1 Tax=Barrientosiimonas humi TaxID=999931 RepID=A0A542XEI6_9MICO|nr:DUF6414 family protein [Barrientosiimonas humi]TQL34228.1 hypothetical protein FB554_2391 [Barrientosiimonas humi]CAG7574220.1 hypothetical protein BH39T_PBIAJDOK_02863 [Barrientosiimonas humi]
MATDTDHGNGDLIKVVYFDEQSASDYLDISAGGKAVTTAEDVRQRANNVHAEVEAKVAAKLSWLPFIGGSAGAGTGVEASRTGQSMLSKTLSNTILTDYLAKSADDHRVRQLRGLRVTAPGDSMAYMKMFTPYMIIAKTEDQGIDLARLDEALAGAKGYYELLGEADDDVKHVLRFNIAAFRNNYGLTDLGRMRLVFHAVHVGHTTERGLGMEAEMSTETETSTLPTAAELVDGAAAQPGNDLLDVYDVVLAGVEYGE